MNATQDATETKPAAPTLTRTQAATFIERVRELAAEQSAVALAAGVARLLSEAGLPPLERCTGHAHSPEVAGNQDNCTCCAPRWGWIGPKVTVR